MRLPTRYVQRGKCCTWCGHARHPGRPCEHDMILGPDETAPCRCAAHRQS